MSRPQITREAWLSSIRAQIEPVGDCMEWQGAYMGVTPLVYCPRDFVWPGNSQSRQSVRSVLYTLTTGERLKPGQLIRPRCWNERCVHEDHFGMLTREDQPREQHRRGELSTAKRRMASIRMARERSPLTQDKVIAIRTSGDSTEVEAARHGVSPQTITAIRRGQHRAETLPGASVFSWRPAA